ncbi:hypothetical protein EDD22DRAFT_872142 [Suillus occidentalis]|nr:hypothetical protein EDD22DRAFT_872142 [Suillus occidentalis]
MGLQIAALLLSVSVSHMPMTGTKTSRPPEMTRPRSSCPSQATAQKWTSRCPSSLILSCVRASLLHPLHPSIHHKSSLE